MKKQQKPFLCAEFFSKENRKFIKATKLTKALRDESTYTVPDQFYFLYTSAPACDHHAFSVFYGNRLGIII